MSLEIKIRKIVEQKEQGKLRQDASNFKATLRVKKGEDWLLRTVLSLVYLARPMGEASQDLSTNWVA